MATLFLPEGFCRDICSLERKEMLLRFQKTSALKGLCFEGV